ncbi:MAG: Rrf2 family transcriptional regulator [Rhodospirillaceae bacterium]|jgi:Rrf2 family iron-sulfur cluster assembly transcriptional regulator|nr:Rrf2 family transcriptional regulator [Rhodospirillaceae bacterium]
MKLSTKGRYAVMAMVELAQRSGGQPVALADIAESQGISLSYLEQLFAKLRRGGVVKSMRGPGGGYTLSKAAERIRIADVVLAVDEPAKSASCSPISPDGCCSNQAQCSTHDLWEALGNQIYGFLNSVTIADVCARRISGTGQPVWSSDHRSATA